MSVVVYRPAEILEWVQLGAESLRSLPGMDERGTGVGEVVRDAFDRALGYGKGAFAGLGAKGIEKLQYRLFDDYFEVYGVGPTKTIRYDEVRHIEIGKRGATRVVLAKGSLSIKPYAWLSVANVRFPMGWLRNGMEAGYESLIEEIGARARISARVGS